MAVNIPAAAKDDVFDARFYRKKKVEMVEVRRKSTGDVVFNGRAHAVWRKHRGQNITYAERFAKPAKSAKPNH